MNSKLLTFYSVSRSSSFTVGTCTASDIVILQSFIIEIFLPLVGNVCEEKDLVMTCECPFWKLSMLFCPMRFYLSIQLIQWNYCVMLINTSVFLSFPLWISDSWFILVLWRHIFRLWWHTQTISQNSVKIKENNPPRKNRTVEFH